MSDWLQPLRGEWLDGACELLADGEAVVRVTVVQRRGSAPREAGASLLVTATRLIGSIGGGNLEWQALHAARAQLQDAGLPAVRLLDLTLGPDLKQCCGGRVQLWCERLTRVDLAALEGAHAMLRDQAAVSIVTHVSGKRVTRQFALPAAAGVPALRLQARPDGSMTLVEGWQRRLPPLWIFGAGHVGQAIVRLLADLPLFEVTWIDSRARLLPATLPTHVRALVPAAPVDCIAQLPPAASVLVLTHDHALDYALCRAVLLRGQFAWLGLIGSASKRARFRSRLAREGIAAQLAGRLCCPIGVPGIASRLPAAIAVSVLAQLLSHAGVAMPLRAPGVTADGSVACGADCADCDTPRRQSL